MGTSTRRLAMLNLHYSVSSGGLFPEKNRPEDQSNPCRLADRRRGAASQRATRSVLRRIDARQFFSDDRLCVGLPTTSLATVVPTTTASTIATVPAATAESA